MDPTTARRYLRLERLPSEVKKERPWRTRGDPFSEVWDAVQKQIEESPGLEAKTLFEWLQREHPGRFSDGQIRTLQRRIKLWRVTEGPGAGSVLRPGARAGAAVRVGLHAHDRAGDHAGRADVRTPGVPLRADVFELGNGHDLLFREPGEPQRRMAERGLGVGRGGGRAPHRQPVERGEQHEQSGGVQPAL